MPKPAQEPVDASKIEEQELPKIEEKDVDELFRAIEEHDAASREAAARQERSSAIFDLLDDEVEKQERESREFAKLNLHEVVSRSSSKAALAMLGDPSIGAMRRDTDPEAKAAEMFEKAVAKVRTDARAPSLETGLDPQLLIESDEKRATIEQSRRDTARMVDDVIRGQVRSALASLLKEELAASQLDWERERIGRMKAAIETIDAEAAEEKPEEAAAPAAPAAKEKKPILSRLRGLFGKK